MLLLSTKMWTVPARNAGEIRPGELVCVFPDHDNKNQFWYIPSEVELAVRSDNKIDFILYTYRGATSGTGGFLNFGVHIPPLAPEVENNIKRKLAADPDLGVTRESIRLSPVPVDEGTVRCIGLDSQGRTDRSEASTGGAVFVKAVDKPASPSLSGDNKAIFSLSLSADGATLCEKAFQDQTTPLGVVYDLKYTAMRPALKVWAKVDYKRVYDHFSANLEVQYEFNRAGVEAGFERLQQDGAIQIRVIKSIPGMGDDEQMKWALDLIKAQIINDFFSPTLTLGEFKGGFAKAEDLDKVVARGQGISGGGSGAGAGTSSGEKESAGGETPTGEKESAGGETPTGEKESAGGETPTGEKESAGGEKPTGEKESAGGEKPTGGDSGSDGSVPITNTVTDVSKALVSAASGVPIISFKLKYMRQEERKTAEFTFERSEAVKRTMAPQGLIGLLLEGKNPDLTEGNYFKRYDLNNPFFRELQVGVAAPVDFKAVGLTRAQVELHYGDDHRQFQFTTRTDAEQQLNPKIYLDDKSLSRTYTYDATYRFDPSTEWIGEKNEYKIPTQSTEETYLNLDPSRYLGFLNIRVSPHPTLNWDQVEAVDVQLRYDSPTWKPSTTLTFTSSAKEAQSWKLRLTNPSANTYYYKFVYTMADGTRYETKEYAADGVSQVIINNPFETMLSVSFDAGQIDWKKARSVVVTARVDGRVLPSITLDSKSTAKELQLGSADKGYSWAATLYAKSSQVGDRGKVRYPKEATKYEQGSEEDPLVYLDSYFQDFAVS